MSTPPFTVVASASAAMPDAEMPPFTVFPTKRTPAGTLTRNSTLTSLSFTFMRPPSPGAHVLGVPDGRVHGAQRDAARVLDDLDLHLRRVALPALLHGGDLDLAAASRRSR